MRQAVAPSESVENNSFEVTNLFKICSHCQRLRKKVRERRKGKQKKKKNEHIFPTGQVYKSCVACVFGAQRCHKADALLRPVFLSLSLP